MSAEHDEAVLTIASTLVGFDYDTPDAARPRDDAEAILDDPATAGFKVVRA